MKVIEIPKSDESVEGHTIEAYVKKHPQYAEVFELYARQYPGDISKRVRNALEEIGYKFKRL